MVKIQLHSGKKNHKIKYIQGGPKNVTTFNPYTNLKNEHLFEIFFHRCLTKISN